MFNNIKDAINWLENQIRFKPKDNLFRMKNAIKYLNIDFSNITKIHVAGTNGKGSVVTYLTNILYESGYNVGAFISPYLLKFNERISVNLTPIDDTTLLFLINYIYDFNLEYQQVFDETFSFFELLTLICFKHFSTLNLDYMIIEVGIGGLLDSTNAINYDISAITNIGFDHMKQLGDTIESIATNKLGILKLNNTLVTTMDNSLKPLANKLTKDLNVKQIWINEYKLISHNPLKFSYKDNTYTLKMLGDYQVANAALAIEIVNEINKEISVNTIKNGLIKSFNQGRLEEIVNNVYIDGAHNLPAVIALNETCKTLFKGKKIRLILSFLGDKDIDKMLPFFKDITNDITLTSFIDARYKDLSSVAKEYSINYASDFDFVIKHELKFVNNDTILIITGSLHFIGFVKNYFLKHQKRN